MKSNHEINKIIVAALKKFNETNKTVSDRITLRSELMAVVPEIEGTDYEGEFYETSDEERISIIEAIEEQIPLTGEIPGHITSPISSGSIGWAIMNDSFFD